MTLPVLKDVTNHDEQQKIDLDINIDKMSDAQG